MNKLQLYKGILKIAEELGKPEVIKQIGEQIASAESLSEEKREEAKEALKIIDDCKVAEKALIVEEEKLAYLHEFKIALEKERLLLNERESSLNKMMDAYELNNSKYEADLKDLALKENDIVKSNIDLDLRTESLKQIERELQDREKALKAREDKHKSFFESIIT